MSDNDTTIDPATGGPLADDTVSDDTVAANFLNPTGTAPESADAEDVAEPEVTFDLTASEDDAEDSSEFDDEEDEEEEDKPWQKPGDWYVVHTQSGYEKKVRQSLEHRVRSMDMGESIYEVTVPEEDVVEFKQGRKQTVKKKVFPGYLLVRCDMTDEAWFCIRNTPGVSGFVGQSQKGQKPTPLSRREVKTFLGAKGDGTGGTKRRAPKLEYEIGESVRVKEGPFADFNGTVAELNPDHLKMKVLVNIFGRETLVEMDFGQVAKL